MRPGLDLSTAFVTLTLPHEASPPLPPVPRGGAGWVNDWLYERSTTSFLWSTDLASPSRPAILSQMPSTTAALATGTVTPAPIVPHSRRPVTRDPNFELSLDICPSSLEDRQKAASRAWPRLLPPGARVLRQPPLDERPA